MDPCYFLNEVLGVNEVLDYLVCQPLSSWLVTRVAAALGWLVAIIRQEILIACSDAAGCRGWTALSCYQWLMSAVDHHLTTQVQMLHQALVLSVGLSLTTMTLTCVETAAVGLMSAAGHQAPVEDWQRRPVSYSWAQRCPPSAPHVQKHSPFPRLVSLIIISWLHVWSPCYLHPLYTRSGILE